MSKGIKKNRQAYEHHGDINDQERLRVKKLNERSNSQKRGEKNLAAEDMDKAFDRSAIGCCSTCLRKQQNNDFNHGARNERQQL